VLNVFSLIFFVIFHMFIILSGAKLLIITEQCVFLPFDYLSPAYSGLNNMAL
jgi:hypothetical protein